MKNTFFSSVSFKFLTAFLIVALALATVSVTPALAAVGVVTQWNSTAVINTGTATSPQTGTYTVAAGTNRLLVVTAALEYSAVTAHNVSATYGGQALTLITQNTAQRQTIWVGYLNEAGIALAGNTTLSVSFNTTNFTRMVVHAATYSGIDQSAPVVDSASTSNNAVNALSFSNIAVTNGGYIFYVTVRDNSGNATPPAGGGYTEHFDTGYGGPPVVFAKSTASKAVAATGTETRTVSFGGGNVGTALSVVSLNPGLAPAITSVAPAGGDVNNPYSHMYTATGTTPITYSVTAGALPPGLTISSAGLISGTPTTAGTFTGTVTASNGFTPNATQDFSITIDKADTVTTVTSDTPDPSASGQSVTVNYTVIGAFGNSPTALTGNVTVSDGVDSCIGAVAAGQCNITLTTDGARTLTATYNGDANFNTSSSSGVPHTVDAIPPDTNITSNPTDPTTSTSAAFTFTGTDGGTGVASFECQIDGSGFSACSSPQNYAGLSEGSHTFEVRAIDNVGNIDPTPASFTWTIDTTAPDTTITANPANPTLNSSASFSFTGSDSGSGVASFECQLDGGGFSVCTSPQNYAGLSDGSHTFEARAIDNIGNVDPTPASFTWTVDTTAPDTAILATPPNSDTDNTPVFTFNSPDPAATFECQIDGGGYSPCNSGDTFGPLSDGAHTFDIRAVDPAGNVDPTPASYTWTIDTTTPDTTILITPPSPDNDTTPSFTFDSTDPTATFECQIDGGGYSPCNPGDTFGPLAGGSHTFDVRAVDSVSNTDPTPASYTWTLDLGAPDTNILSTPANPSSVTTATFTFSSPDVDVVGYECQLDGGGFNACTSPRNYAALSAGSHTFDVRAIDNASNVDPTPASYTWVIDLGFPTVTTSTPSNNATVATGPVSVTVTFSEDVKSDGSAGAANNTVNYLLIENGANNIFNTLSCAGGLVADDTLIPVNSVTYTNNGGSGPFTVTVNINGGTQLSPGTYRLFVCGTTSIEDLANNELNNGVSDAQINFVVDQPPAGGGGGGSGGSSTSGVSTSSGFLIPVTGFAQGRVTDLPAQPVSLTYAPTDIWMEVPKLNIKLTIVGIPQTDKGWDISWLGRNAGWLNGSAFPTWKGNSVITAHVWDALNKPGPFVGLVNLVYGDQIKIHAFGQIYTYEVTASQVVRPSDIAAAFKHEEKSWLTLITCENYQEKTESYSGRRIVRAVLVSVEKEK